MAQLSLMQQIQQDQITGFSRSFTAALVKKLKRLKAEDKIFKGGLAGAKEDERLNSNSGKCSFTEIAYIVVEKLQNQISYPERPRPGTCLFPSKLERFISVAEEFLAIFEKG